MTDDLTPAQYRVLKYLVAFCQRNNGRFPRGSQIAREFGFTSSSSAYEHLLTLERKGYVTAPRRGGWRRYALTQKAMDLRRGIPLVGRISAGPTWHAEDAEPEWVTELTHILPGIRQGDYLLAVDGDSMHGAGLYPGMLALLRPGIVPNPGDICAVWVEGDGGTLKRVYHEGDCVRLAPENPAYDERIVGVDEVSIQGVLLSAISVTQYR
ncbi:MAG: LexA family transcriptional regulator [Rubricoccaceae bacterium]|nr:LexA family transcriptional regulator [Rubricoccaceae bacterium]